MKAWIDSKSEKIQEASYLQSAAYSQQDEISTRLWHSSVIKQILNQTAEITVKRIYIFKKFKQQRH